MADPQVWPHNAAAIAYAGATVPLGCRFPGLKRLTLKVQALTVDGEIDEPTALHLVSQLAALETVEELRVLLPGCPDVREPPLLETTWGRHGLQDAAGARVLK